jgi:hypothetical protein
MDVVKKVIHQIAVLIFGGEFKVKQNPIKMSFSFIV